MATTQRWVLVSRPAGLVDETNFALEDVAVPTMPSEGFVVVEATYFSVDPYMRGRMNATKSYSAPWTIGQAPEGGLVGIVRETPAGSPFAVGDIVRAFGPWQKIVLLPVAAVQGKLSAALPVETQMSVLGMTGLSAYLPIVNIAAPKPGQVAFVSAAAGAVGQVACQVLRNMGCVVIACAGSDEKVAYLKSLGIEKTFNYKTTSAGDALPALAPDGLDIYFDNVGGEMLEFALTNMKLNGTIISCGMISDYNREAAGFGVRNLFNIITKRLKLQGFIVSDYAAQFGAGVAALSAWLAEGKLQGECTVVDGFASIPTAFVNLFKGLNTGKMLVKC